MALSSLNPLKMSDFFAHHQRQQTPSFLFFKQNDISLNNLNQCLNQNLEQNLLKLESESEFKEQIRIIRNAVQLAIIHDEAQHINLSFKAEQVNKVLNASSQLADFLIRTSYRYAYQNLSEKFGEVFDSQGKAQPMMVLALGKLGGFELNFSSDIDLMFAYSEEAEMTQAPPNQNPSSIRSIQAHQFYTKLAQCLIDYLNANTTNGFAYRLDARLRPFGDSGPLVNSLSFLENYYQTHGRNWERYALIKARLIDLGQGRNLEQEKSLWAILKPFVYRIYLDFSVFESLREMKQRITIEAEKRFGNHHLKLGSGGIRQLEFLIQMYQLVYGGKQSNLQVQNWQQTLNYLVENHHFTPKQAEVLSRAYYFLRATENRLQQKNDQQTHLLPLEASQLKALTNSLGLSLSGFKNRLKGVQNLIVKQFEGSLIDYTSEDKTTKSSQSPLIKQWQSWQECWLVAEDEALLIQSLKDHQFQSMVFLSSRIATIKQRFIAIRFEASQRKQLRKLMILFLQVLQNHFAHSHPFAIKPTHRPNIKLKAEQKQAQTEMVFDRVVSFIQQIYHNSVAVVLLNGNQKALKLLCVMAQSSEQLIDLLKKNPSLVEQLLEKELLFERLSREKTEQEISTEYSGDLEGEMVRLRIFKDKRLFSIASQDVLNKLSLPKVSNQITHLTEAILKRVLDCVWQDLSPRFSMGEEVKGFCVLAGGKLGGLEMSYASDLDLVFLTADDKHQDFYLRLAQRLVHMLEFLTTSGKLFSVDLRLRPHGQSGALIHSIANWANYQKDQAWTWEKQVLCRMRAIMGDKSLSRSFYRYRRGILQQCSDNPNLEQQIISMRQTMRKNLDTSNTTHFDLKQGLGGIVDIEFLVQFLVLKNAQKHPHLTRYPDNLRQIMALKAAKIIPEKKADKLIDTYFLMRRKNHHLILQNQPHQVPQNAFKPNRNLVRRLWQQHLSVEIKESEADFKVEQTTFDFFR